MAQQYRNYSSQRPSRQRSTRPGPGGFGAIEDTENQWEDETSPQNAGSSDIHREGSRSPYDARDYGRSDTGYGRPTRGQFRDDRDQDFDDGGQSRYYSSQSGDYGSGSDYYSEPSASQYGSSRNRESGQGFSRGGSDSSYGQNYGQGYSQGYGQHHYGQGFGQSSGRNYGSRSAASSGRGSGYEGQSFGSQSGIRDQYGYGSQQSYGGQSSRGQGRSASMGQDWNQNLGSGNYRGKGPKGYQRSDDRLKEMVCERLTDDASIDASTFSVTVKNGEVTLEGTVRDRSTKHRAEDIVEACGGVKEIHNNLRVDRSSQGDDFSTRSFSDNGSQSTSSSSRSSGKPQTNA